MPKVEEVPFLSNIPPLALLGLANVGLPANEGIVGCTCMPGGLGAANMEGFVVATRGGNGNPFPTPPLIEDECPKFKEECMSAMECGKGGLLFIADAATAACRNIAIAAGCGGGTPRGGAPPGSGNEPFSCCLNKCIFDPIKGMLFVLENGDGVIVAEVQESDSIVRAAGTSKIDGLECGVSKGGGGKQSAGVEEVNNGHEESLCVDKSCGREDTLVFRSLVLSTEFSDPDKIAEGLCRDGGGSPPTVAA